MTQVWTGPWSMYDKRDEGKENWDCLRRASGTFWRQIWLNQMYCPSLICSNGRLILEKYKEMGVNSKWPWTEKGYGVKIMAQNWGLMIYHGLQSVRVLHHGPLLGCRELLFYTWNTSCPPPHWPQCHQGCFSHIFSLTSPNYHCTAVVLTSCSSWGASSIDHWLSSGQWQLPFEDTGQLLGSVHRGHSGRPPLPQLVV